MANLSFLSPLLTYPFAISKFYIITSAFQINFSLFIISNVQFTISASSSNYYASNF